MHGVKRNAILRDWLDGYTVKGIARLRRVDVYAVAAALAEKGIPYWWIEQRWR